MPSAPGVTCAAPALRCTETCRLCNGCARKVVPGTHRRSRERPMGATCPHWSGCCRRIVPGTGPAMPKPPFRATWRYPHVLVKVPPCPLSLARPAHKHFQSCAECFCLGFCRIKQNCNEAWSMEAATNATRMLVLSCTSASCVVVSRRRLLVLLLLHVLLFEEWDSSSPLPMLFVVVVTSLWMSSDSVAEWHCQGFYGCPAIFFVFSSASRIWTSARLSRAEALASCSLGS